jgi:uncharacterized membrane protein YgcG
VLEDHWLVASAGASSDIEESARARRYVLVPDGLILAFAHDPLAVGVYAAIARLVVAAKGAVPLAARDLAAWIGSERDADRVAIMRRVVKLEERGWVMATRTRAAKHWLLPTWGCDQAGAARPWQPEQAGGGRPAHVRGRRVPLDLFDGYIGRLDPRPGQCPALISRYVSRPLLDLTDVGVYVVGLRAEVAPTTRLRHLGLHGPAGVTAPAEPQTLMRLAAAGRLTTLVGDVLTPVALSYQGHSQPGIVAGADGGSGAGASGLPGGSHAGSAGRSAGGSGGGGELVAPAAEQGGPNGAVDRPAALIAWDVGSMSEQMKHDSASTPLVIGGGEATVGIGELGDASCAPAPLVDRLADAVIDGHRQLNSGRAIGAGEWYELLALQETCGAERLLIWQARAGRAGGERRLGVVPGYYRACAVRAAADAERVRVFAPASDVTAGPERAAAPPGVLDPACDALLRSMGVRERRQLAGVAQALIAAWQAALGHPGLAAQLASPIGFAVTQMRRGNPPPAAAELDRWAERARRGADRYATWRHVEPLPVDTPPAADERELEARVRALAPPEAGLEALCVLADALEAGASEVEALAALRLWPERAPEREGPGHGQR